MSALKILKKENISTIEQVDQLIREREILKLLTSYQQASIPSIEKQESNNESVEYEDEQICPYTIKIYSSF